MPLTIRNPLNLPPVLKLAFRELEPLARALLTVLFAFFGAWVSRQQSGLFEFLAKFAVELNQSAGYAMTHSACLSGRAAARDVHQHVEFAERIGQLQRLANNHSLRFVLEVSFNRISIDFKIAGSWPQVNTSGRTLTTASSVKLNLSHVSNRS